MVFPFSGRRAPFAGRSGVQDLALLQLELGVVDDTRFVQLTELTELGELRVRVDPSRRRRRSGLGVGLLLLLWRVLVRPAVGLTPGHAVGHGGRGGRADSGAGGPPPETPDLAPSLVGVGAGASGR